jgi:hypothetical protein
MSESGETPTRKRPLGGELIIPVGGALFAIYYTYTVWELAWQANAVGLSVGAAMAVLLVILAVRFSREWARGEADFSLGDVAYPLGTLARRAAILAAAIGFILVMPYLGFTLSMFVFLLAGIVILSGLTQLKRGVLIALAVSLGGYLLFVAFIGARFPLGPVEHFFRSLF